VSVQRPHRRRILAVAVIVVIAAGLLAWELSGPGGRTEAAVGEAAVILAETGSFPATLYVERDVDYRIYVTASSGSHSLDGWPGNAKDGSTRVAPGETVELNVSAGELRDGQRIGPGGPSVRIVDDLGGLAARGEVYYVGLIATEDGLLPRQVRLTEGMKAALGGVSTDGDRLLLIEGARLYLPVSPNGVSELQVDVPTPGVYNVACEQGCGGEWTGAFRVVGSNSEVPWVEDRDADAAAELDRRAPDFALYDRDGRIVQLSDFQNDKPVFINFWATWCRPCRDEMPAMQALYDRMDGEFEILAVNYLESRDQVVEFMEELQVDFPALMDITGIVNQRYGVWAYPTSVFVDRDGIVRGRFMGELSPELMDEFVGRIIE